MILDPLREKPIPMLRHQLLYPFQICCLESGILPKFDRIQEDSYVHIVLPYVDMSRLMIIWIYRDIVTMFLPKE